jgi:ABC-type Zn2+ transport system substrate-binding protein/surface adhesin
MTPKMTPKMEMKRCGNKWTINELLSLQREYELLEWNIQNIALKHKRSVTSILYKLEEEGFILSWSEARGFNSKEYQKQINNNVSTFKEDEDNEQDEDYEEEDEEDEEQEEEEDDEEQDEKANDLDKLSNRVWNLETSLSDISSMVREMFNNLVTKNNVKRAPLRSNKI